MLLAALGLLPCSALAERSSYLVIGASSTSDVWTHEFSHSNRLLINHFAIEQEINADFRAGLSYWRYEMARTPSLPLTVSDPISGFPITTRAIWEQRLSELALTLTHRWTVRSIRPYVGFGLGVFLRDEVLTDSDPDIGRGSRRIIHSENSVDGARILFAGAEYHFTADIVAGLSVYYKFNTDTNTDTKIEYLDRAVEVRYRF